MNEIMNDYIDKARDLLTKANKIEEKSFELVKTAMKKTMMKSVDLSMSGSKSRLYFYYEGDGYEGECCSVVSETSEVRLSKDTLYFKIYEGTEDESMVDDATPVYYADFALDVISLINEKKGNLESELQDAHLLLDSYNACHSVASKLFQSFICEENIEYVNLEDPVESADYAYGEDNHEFSGQITSFFNTEERPLEFGLDYCDVSYGGMTPVDPFHFLLNLIETHFDSK